jgi:hypothetical protein
MNLGLVVPRSRNVSVFFYVKVYNINPKLIFIPAIPCKFQIK